MCAHPLNLLFSACSVFSTCLDMIAAPLQLHLEGMGPMLPCRYTDLFCPQIQVIVWLKSNDLPHTTRALFPIFSVGQISVLVIPCVSKVR